MIMSDRGIPASYRTMHGLGSQTFSFINADSERFWVTFHHRTQQRIKNLTDAEATTLIGADRESSQRDLYEAIERGDFLRWTFYVQIMPEADAATVPYHGRVDTAGRSPCDDSTVRAVTNHRRRTAPEPRGTRAWPS